MVRYRTRCCLHVLAFEMLKSSWHKWHDAVRTWIRSRCSREPTVAGLWASEPGFGCFGGCMGCCGDEWGREGAAAEAHGACPKSPTEHLGLRKVVCSIFPRPGNRLHFPGGKGWRGSCLPTVAAALVLQLLNQPGDLSDRMVLQIQMPPHFCRGTVVAALHNVILPDCPKTSHSSAWTLDHLVQMDNVKYP